MEVGGQLMTTNEVENFPGYPQGIKGPEMMNDLQEQAKRFGTDIRFSRIVSVDFSSNKPPYIVTAENGDVIEAKTIIISTGATAKWLGIESEKRLNGNGVSACAVCDGFFYKNQDVAIVGAGDSACEEALYLSKLCSKVYMLIRRDQMRASKIMQDRVLKASNIEICWNSETDEILGKEFVEGLRIRNNKDHSTREVSISGFFVAIGHTPQSEIFKPAIETDEDGYIKVIPGSTKTNLEGVFACGDVMDRNYRQAITAAGTGCMAALEAERFLAH
jgi:thioredoxin reductase (NADPH)